MTTATPAESASPIQSDRLRYAFKWLNRWMVFWWRLGLGGAGNNRHVSGQIMILTHIGRKSGIRRRTPVNYALVNDELYCVAGFGSGSDWVRNIMANKTVEVWLPQGWWEGVAEDVSDQTNRLPLMRSVLIASGFASRMAGIDPIYMTDAELAQKTGEYRLIRIARKAALAGPGGPGELAWVWPFVTTGLLIALLRRTRQSESSH